MSSVRPEVDKAPSLIFLMRPFPSFNPHFLANPTNSLEILCKNFCSVGLLFAFLQIPLELLSNWLLKLVEPSTKLPLLPPSTGRAAPATRNHATLHFPVRLSREWMAFDDHYELILFIWTWDLILVLVTIFQDFLQVWLKLAVLIVPWRRNKQLSCPFSWLI